MDKENNKWFSCPYLGAYRLKGDGTTVMVDQVIPNDFLISSIHPNPFNPSTTISFTLPKSGKTELFIYSITGQKVRTLLSGSLSDGTHTIVWDGYDNFGKPVSSGVYLARLTAVNRTATGKMLLMK